MSKEILKEQSKCPFTGAGTPPKHPTGKGTSNRDWWPNSLNLKILSQHSGLVNPMDKKFSYAKEFKKLNKVYENLLFENYIPGQEIQVALMGGKSIGAIELKPKRAFYDYKAKYKKSANTLHIMPAQISRKKYNQVLRISEKAYKILKCKGIY